MATFEEQIAETIDALMSSFSITRAEERLARIRALVASDFLFGQPGVSWLRALKN